MLREMTSQQNEMHAPSSSNIERQVAVEARVGGLLRHHILCSTRTRGKSRTAIGASYVIRLLIPSLREEFSMTELGLLSARLFWHFG